MDICFDLQGIPIFIFGLFIIISGWYFYYRKCFKKCKKENSDKDNTIKFDDLSTFLTTKDSIPIESTRNVKETMDFDDLWEDAVEYINSNKLESNFKNYSESTNEMNNNKEVTNKFGSFIPNIKPRTKRFTKNFSIMNTEKTNENHNLKFSASNYNSNPPESFLRNNSLKFDHYYSLENSLLPNKSKANSFGNLNLERNYQMLNETIQNPFNFGKSKKRFLIHKQGSFSDIDTNNDFNDKSTSMDENGSNSNNDAFCQVNNSSLSTTTLQNNQNFAKINDKKMNNNKFRTSTDTGIPKKMELNLPRNVNIFDNEVHKINVQSNKNSTNKTDAYPFTNSNTNDGKFISKNDHVGVTYKRIFTTKKKPVGS